MTVPDDHVAARTQVVRVYIAELIGPDALYPHRRPAANVGTVPWTVPVLTRRPPGRGAELREPVRLRVPGPRGEVVEAVEAVVLVPDEPAPGVGGGGGEIIDRFGQDTLDARGARRENTRKGQTARAATARGDVHDPELHQ